MQVSAVNLVRFKGNDTKPNSSGYVVTQEVQDAVKDVSDLFASLDSGEFPEDKNMNEFPEGESTGKKGKIKNLKSPLMVAASLLVTIPIAFLVGKNVASKATSMVSKNEKLNNSTKELIGGVSDGAKKVKAGIGQFINKHERLSKIRDNINGMPIVQKMKGSLEGIAGKTPQEKLQNAAGVACSVGVIHEATTADTNGDETPDIMQKGASWLGRLEKKIIKYIETFANLIDSLS